MKLLTEKSLWFTVIATLCLIVVTLFAAGGCEKPEYHTVNFKGEGVAVNPQSVEHGKCATVPKNPEREGYDFVGWFTDNGTFTNEWNFKTNIVTQDTTLYAKWEENIMQDYPIEIPFEDYSLVGTSCQWIDLSYNDTVVIINSYEDLSKYLTCTDDNYPEIDFSKHTLLLANGLGTSSVVNSNCTSLRQLSKQNFEMKVDVLLGFATVMSRWEVPIVVNKLKKESTIKLIVTDEQHKNEEK